MGVGALGKNLPQIPNDAEIRSRIYVQKEIDTHPLLQAAIGFEWSYSGGFNTSATQTPARASAGSFGVNHAKLHAEVERVKQRREFALNAAQSGMLEIGSDAFNVRFPIGVAITRGAIGDEMIKDLPVKLLIREGEKLVEVSGIQRGDKNDKHGMAESLLVESGGKTREVAYDKIEVAFAADPLKYHADVARDRGLKEVDTSGAIALLELNGKPVTLIAKTRDYVPYGQPDRRPIQLFQGTLEMQSKPGQFKIAGVEGYFNLSELGPGQLFAA